MGRALPRFCLCVFAACLAQVSDLCGQLGVLGSVAQEGGQRDRVAKKPQNAAPSPSGPVAWQEGSVAALAEGRRACGGWCC
jgi:hypothetical protein